MPDKKLRRRITGPLPAVQREHFRQATREVDAQEAAIKARGRARLEALHQGDLPQLVSVLRAVRVSRGLSAADVATRLEMDAGNYSRLESGQTNPTLSTLSRLAEAIGVTVTVEVR
jgi:ribosome-binding protein aMBF1 (putative translation factor)